MSTDEKRDAVEEIAAQRDNTLDQYESDLNPQYPKWVATCECGWSASSFDSDEQDTIEVLGRSHTAACSHTGTVVFNRYDEPDGDGQLLATLGGEE